MSEDDRSGATAVKPAVKPAVTCSVCTSSGASCLRKEELKDDAKKLADKAKTALHGRSGQHMADIASLSHGL